MMGSGQVGCSAEPYPPFVEFSLFVMMCCS